MLKTSENFPSGMPILVAGPDIRGRKGAGCDVESRNMEERIGIFEKAYLYSQLEYAHAARNTDIRFGIQVCTRQTVFKSVFCIFFFVWPY